MSRLARRISIIALALAITTPSQAEDLSTSFEFIDFTGSFTLGTPPATASFSTAVAQTVPSPALAHSGSNAWIIAPNTGATITFANPVESVTLFHRNELATSSTVITAIDTTGQALTSATSTTTYQQFTATSFLNGPLIQHVTVAHAGQAGIAVVDDFTMCLTAGGGPIDDPVPGPIAASNISVQLVPIATGLIAPNWGVSAPGVSHNRLFVTDQPGQLYAINLDSGEKVAVLDVSAQLVPLGIVGPGSFDERGLLGVAFHPNYGSNGLLYTYTSEPLAGPADFSSMPAGVSADHHAVITEWRIANPSVAPSASNPASLVDPSSERELMRIDQPQFNHDGGGINFGPDGFLYVALGDGGAADDQGDGHDIGGNGQNTTNLLGSVLRIDPLGNNSVNGRYGVPASNPFVGPDGVVDEIYAYGFRNPYRFSFDIGTTANPGSGDLYLGDVGQGDIEEIDIVTSGGNYGWPCKEGSFFFNANGDSGGFATDVPPHAVPAGLIDPIAQYDHDEGISVIGGFVYRGSKIPALSGLYVFAEFAKLFSLDGRLFHLDATNQIVEFPLVGQAAVDQFILGFGQDAAGELYVLANGTGVPFPGGSGDPTGVVLRIAPQAPFVDLAQGTAGSNGTVPSLTGSGPLTAGSSNTILLSDSAPNAITVLVAGTQNDSADLLGAVTLVPSPDAILIGPTTDGLGELITNFNWSASITAGTTFFVQYLVTDAGTPIGFSASGALQVTGQ